MTDLAIVTTYFNPCGYHNRRTNYQVFAQGCRSIGAELFTVECVFGEDEPFDLPPGANVIQLRASSVMWQKERLINQCVLKYIPKNFTKIAWVDCDLIFANLDWAKEASDVLDRHKIIQPFEFVDRLPQNGGVSDSTGDVSRSFAAVWTDRSIVNRTRWEDHGHTGYAWAARRDLFEHCGLYDAGILGNGDHFMAHAFTDEMHSECITEFYQTDDLIYLHLRDWATRAYEYCQGDIGYVEGVVYHLWHGEHANRRYIQRHQQLRMVGYNPYTDIAIDDQGCFRWASHRPGLVELANEHFKLRKEDG
ncbi:MAG: hypothetical protein LW724_12200 [Planctomycetaceae bacterium]|nr:hypothetical protein [Planctomycetaceae bacterium]